MCIRDRAEHKDKDKDLEGVAERGLPDGLGMALFVAVLLVAIHLVGVAGVAAAQACLLYTSRCV